MSPIRLRVRELRELRGMTQHELAERAGLREATLSNIETGRVVGVRFETLERLADVLGVDPAMLIERVQAPPRGRRSRSS